MIVDTNIAISGATFYPLQGHTASWIAPVNILLREKQVKAIAALCEGVSIRATERLTGVNRGTILSLGVRVGDGCAVLHDAMMRGLHVSRIELDEAWSFVAKKQRHLKPNDPDDFGDQYAFLALAGAGKAIISWRVGKRNGENCRAFLADLRARVLGAPEISSDGFPAYPDAVERAFGIECTFGTIEKHYAVETAVEAARRYSPAAVVSVTTAPDMVGKGRGDRGSAPRDLLLEGESPREDRRLSTTPRLCRQPTRAGGPAPLQSPLWLNSNAVLYRPFDSVR